MPEPSKATPPHSTASPHSGHRSGFFRYSSRVFMAFLQDSVTYKVVEVIVRQVTGRAEELLGSCLPIDLHLSALWMHITASRARALPYEVLSRPSSWETSSDWRFTPFLGLKMPTQNVSYLGSLPQHPFVLRTPHAKLTQGVAHRAGVHDLEEYLPTHALLFVALDFTHLSPAG